MLRRIINKLATIKILKRIIQNKENMSVRDKETTINIFWKEEKHCWNYKTTMFILRTEKKIIDRCNKFGNNILEL